jgi:hypothetical protein
MTSTPGSITETGATSPITVSGLTSGTAYTFKVKSNNPFGSSAESAASNSVTPFSVAYESIATVTVSGSASSITFSSIPQTYTHLQIRGIARSTGALTGAYVFGDIMFNSDFTGTNYYQHYLEGNGSSVSAAANNHPLWYWAGDNNTNANIYGGVIFDILDYTNTNKNKTVRILGGVDNNGSGAIDFHSIVWNNTAAISSIRLTIPFGSYGVFQNKTTFALYGIKSA